MTAANWDASDLAGIETDGWIYEDVLAQIWDVSRLPLVMTDLIGRQSTSNPYTSWLIDRLPDPDTTNAHIDGSDPTQNDIDSGNRIGNHHQISLKRFQVSSRADAVNTIGFNTALARQVIRNQQALARDEEAIMTTAQASTADTGAAAGKTAGLGAWIATNYQGGATGQAGGFNTTTKEVDAPTEGTKFQLTEVMIRDMIENVWKGGASVDVIVSVPEIIRSFNEYLFTSSARIATLQGRTSADSGGDGLYADGYVHTYLSDHGQVVKLVSNRLQQYTGTADAATMFFLDPSYWRRGTLRGRQVEPLAKNGLNETRMISEDWCTISLNEESSGQIADIDIAQPVIAGT